MAGVKKSRPVWRAPLHGGFALATTSNASAADGAVKLSLIDIPNRCIVERIAWINAATVQDRLRVGIYTTAPSGADDANGGTLLYDSGNISQSGVSQPQEHILTTQVLLEPGRYYLAFITEGTTMTYMRHGNTSQGIGFSFIFTRSGGFGALPATVPTATDSPSAIPGMKIRVIEDYQVD